MKKLFYSLSLALAGVIAANAATPQVSLSAPVIDGTSSTYVQRPTAKKLDGQTKASNKAKRNVTASDFYGNWQWVSESVLESTGVPTEGVLTIEPIEGSDQVVIRGFNTIADYCMGGLKGYFKNNRIYIPNQTISPADNVFGIGETLFVNYTFQGMTDEEKAAYEAEHGPGSADNIVNIVPAADGYEFFFELYEEYETPLIVCWHELGEDADYTNQVYLENYCVAGMVPANDRGFYWLCVYVQGWPVDFFVFDPSEWTSIGDAQFMDAWMNPLYDNSVAAYSVPAYRSLTNDNRYLLLDPYGPNTPFGKPGPWGEGALNVSDTEGYLVFNVTYPGCVLFEPFVYSLGIYMDDQVQSLYNLNQEGYDFFLQGTEASKIQEVYLNDGKKVSNFDSTTGRVNIYNGIFNITPLLSLGETTNWQDSDTGASLDMSGYIILPSGFDAVETILGEENNAPVEYFNLQGVRVNNPQQGQLVIKRQGTKSVKEIVR